MYNKNLNSFMESINYKNINDYLIKIVRVPCNPVSCLLKEANKSVRNFNCRLYVMLTGRNL